MLFPVPPTGVAGLRWYGCVPRQAPGGTAVLAGELPSSGKVHGGTMLEENAI